MAGALACSVGCDPGSGLLTNGNGSAIEGGDAPVTTSLSGSATRPFLRGLSSAAFSVVLSRLTDISLPASEVAELRGMAGLEVMRRRAPTKPVQVPA